MANRSKRNAGARALWYFLGAIIILTLIGMSFYQTATGAAIADADDLTAVTCKNKTGSTVTVSSVSGKGKVVEFTLAAIGAKVSLDLDYDIGDLKDYATIQLILDLTGLEVNGTDKLKVYLSDAAGDTDYYLGYTSKITGIVTFSIDYEKIEDKSLSETADIFVVLVCYDKDGLVANGLKADDQEVGLQITSGGGYAGSGAIGLFGATAVSLLAAVRKVVAGIMSALSSFLTVIFTNNTLVILIVAVVVALLVLMVRDKTIRGTLGP